MSEVLMPRLSDAMEEGTVLTWLKHTGETVEIGDELVEIETDKATITYSAETAGVLETLLEEGGAAAVGEPIARLGTTASPATGSAATSGPEADVDGRSPTSHGNVGAANGEAELRPPPALSGTGSATDRRDRSATPLARRVAAVHNVPLGNIAGTGPLGRITRNDVLREAGQPVGEPLLPRRHTSPRSSGQDRQTPTARSEPTHTPSSPLPVATDGIGPPVDDTRQQPNRLQQLIARRMVEAKTTVPHFQIQTDVLMDSALALRGELKAAAGEAHPAPSVNDMIIKAAALALRAHPLANGSFQQDTFVLHEHVNVGMAVAAEGALVVPTIFDAADRSLGEIARETRGLAGRVRDGSISPVDLEGGTFTVSNLGMFGMTAIYPVINPPQAAILGVGASRPTLARVDGEIVDQSIMTLTLSCDHRILYGADAARFLAEIRELLHTPLRLAL